MLTLFTTYYRTQLNHHAFTPITWTNSATAPKSFTRVSLKKAWAYKGWMEHVTTFAASVNAPITSEFTNANVKDAEGIDECTRYHIEDYTVKRECQYWQMAKRFHTMINEQSKYEAIKPKDEANVDTDTDFIQFLDDDDEESMLMDVDDCKFTNDDVDMSDLEM
jgi:hypothetical protein